MGTAYVVQTWTDGSSSASAARFNYMETGIYNGQFQPAARVTHGTAQSISASVNTVLAFNTESFDTDTIHDTVTNNSRLTCKTAGKYAIKATVEFAPATDTTRRIVDLLLNGVTVIARTSVSAQSAGHTVIVAATDYDLAVNDYVETRVTQDSSGALLVTSTSAYAPTFMMVRVA